MEASDIDVYRPGGRQQSEELATGMLARAFGDPAFAPFLISVAVASFLLNLFFGFFHFLAAIRNDE